MMINRRQFLTSLLQAGVATGSLTLFNARVFALPQTSECKTLVIFLRGAYDGLNCLVPYKESFYYEIRPTIAISPPDGNASINNGNTKSLIALSSDFGLHPALKDNIYPLFNQREVIFIPDAGQQDNSRSHFHAQDMMEYGYSDGQGNFSSGFLNRFIDTMKGSPLMLEATSYTNNLPIILKGDTQVPNVSLAGDVRTHLNNHQISLYQQMYQNNRLGTLIDEGINTRNSISKELDDEMKAANRGAITAKGFASQTHKIATLMKNSPHASLGFIDVGGWDTHVNQGASDGQYANNLKNLGDGLLEFRNTMGEQWKNTTVIVISEFGRTAHENGNRGTDHGHGNVMWLLGGSLKGGRITGHWNGLNAQNLHENRDLNVYNDYRSVIGNLWTRTYGLNNNQLAQIFPGYQKQDLNLI
jgi:uncharacterized protein (DUF1501 family)